MILEHVVLPVACERQAEVELAFAQGQQGSAASPGFAGPTLARGIESPDSYLLRVEWESLEAHTEGFRGSAAYARWSELLHPCYAPRPEVQDFEPVAEVHAEARRGAGAGA
ncbi:MAG: Antibiotic biosynthesis monooxygenase [Naasia sp.]|jgi:heme-degrading monooxygenase HmoA|nr:Antibiotic biosynthesis monooxygenase [Naasia sp.]